MKLSLGLAIAASSAALLTSWGLAQYDQLYLANLEMARSFTLHCYARGVGETVTLALIDNEIVCLRSTKPVPRDAWARVLKEPLKKRKERL